MLSERIILSEFFDIIETIIDPVERREEELFEVNPELSLPHSMNIERVVIDWALSCKKTSLVRSMLTIRYCLVYQGDGRFIADYKRLGELLSYTEQTARNHIKQLSELGFIHKDPRVKNGWFLRSRNHICWKIRGFVGETVRASPEEALRGLQPKPKRRTEREYTIKLPTEYLTDTRMLKGVLLYALVYICCRSQLYQENQNRKGKQKANLGAITLPFLISCETIGNWFGFSKMTGSNYRKMLLKQGWVNMNHVYHITDISSEEQAEYLRNEEDFYNLRYNYRQSAFVLWDCSQIIPLDFETVSTASPKV